MNTHGTGGIQLHAFLTSTLNGCKGSTSHQAGLPHRKKYQVPTEYEAGKAMEPFLIIWRKEKSLVPVKNLTTIPKLSKIYPRHLWWHNYFDSNNINISSLDLEFQFPKTSGACIMITMTLSVNASCNTLCKQWNFHKLKIYFMVAIGCSPLQNTSYR
jgi:hypothetical protein